jgi:hypothetical protein
MKLVNLLVAVALIGGFIYAIWTGYSVTPTDMLTLAVLNVVIYGERSNKKIQ